MSLDEAAFKAAVLGFDLEGARACLEAGVSPEVVIDKKRARRKPNSDQWPSGFRALHIAAFEDDVPLAELLLAAGADVESQTAFNQRALSLAASWDSPGVLELLLAAGARVGRELVAAAGHGHRAVAIRLIALSAPDVRDDAARISCGREGDPVVLDALLASGARLEQQDDQPGARWAALDCRKYAILEILKGTPRYSVVDAAIDGDLEGFALEGDLDDALAGAAGMGHREVCRALVDAGADVNARSTMGTPMKLALERDDLELARQLRAAGAKLGDRYGAYFEQLIGRKLARETFAFMNAQKRARKRALPRAASAGDLAALRVLLDDGHDPNASDAFGRRALALAADIPSVEAVTALLEAGADPRARGAGGVSVLRYLLTYDDVTEDWLDKSAAIDPDNALHVLKRPAVRLLLEHGASLEDDL